MDVKKRKNQAPVKKADPIVEYIDSPKQISASGRCVIFFESVTDYEAMQHHKEGFKVYCISDAVTKEETVAYCYKKDDTAVADQKKPSIRGEKDSNKNSEEEDEDDLARLIFATFMSSLPEAPPGFPMQSRGKKSNPGRRFPKESKKSVVPSVEDEEEWHDEDTHGSFNPADPKCK